ncbi:ornithine cyclodeaminase family protein (plasmid) [Staphylococcus aureus]|uniref:ornithine cyclodeaminase family protein n=1 Tax=Staphylococcus aureus TaxID=1280 RepID=UPI002025C8F6|nr:ornithine cyclodeaminase family protein [Staphylococcus aureus]MCL9691536.1 ornithine cyclodeaminase [Staphylococcus aureus]MCL9695079.1 ornithine cyclodeaminase [Staphylococcus aureus]MCO4428186.1 ornithine cyclodeaminase [Staphylococcus aureus]MCO4434353.1 ornithine cyclodeaminase [Staphylococcus aureus]MDF3297015.1 ornithine cyclodeaminase family protein [Staphylococcus aureus]
MLFLNEQELQKLLNMKELIEEVKIAFKAFSRGQTKTPSRYVLPFNKENKYLVMPSISDELKIIGTKIVTFAPNNSNISKKTITGVVVLNDYKTGETLAVLDGNYLTKVRTGAISGLATKYLARENSRTLCVIGSGDQAEGLIMAVMAVRPITMIHISSRTKENAERLAQRMSEKYNVSTQVYKDADDAIKNSDIILTATDSTKPVFQGGIEPGAHINAVGSFKPDMQEISSKCFLEFDKIVVESLEAAIKETGDLKIPIEEGVISPNSLYGELGDIALGKIKGRENDREITLFKSVGLAIVDIIVAQYFYKKAILEVEKK